MSPPFPPLLRSAHVAHAKRCLLGLPQSMVEYDSQRAGIAFYCLGIMDLLGVLHEQRPHELENWREWLWEQQTQGEWGSGFRPGTFMTGQHPPDVQIDCTKYDTPHVIMTYTTLLTLAMLRDDFARLNRAGIPRFLASCQREDGSFSTVPGDAESDLRTLYCAFAISSMLNDWSGVNIERALQFIASCRTYEGGYGQSSNCEAHGGTTYIALAAIYLAPPSPLFQQYYPTPAERQQTIRWLMKNQFESGGFCGRTGKTADACYCFWCGAALQILGASDMVDRGAMAKFLASCQFKFGGIAKVPEDTPDPYHTYLSLAALSILPPDSKQASQSDSDGWKFEDFDTLLNAKKTTAEWARRYIPAQP